MPSKDPVRRQQVMKAWRSRAHTPEYMKWLYARRKINATKVAIYESALRTITRDERSQMCSHRNEAEAALAAAAALEREVGNRFDHEKKRGYWEEGK